MRKRVVFYAIMVVLQFLCRSGYSQEMVWNTITPVDLSNKYQKIKQYYNSLTNYSVELTYTSYRDYTSMEEVDKSTGFYHRSNKNFHSYIMGSRTIQNEKYRIVVDETKRIVMVGNPEKEADFVLSENSPSLKGVSALKESKKREDTYYRIEYAKAFDIRAIEYTVNPLGWVKEITFFYQRTAVNEKGVDETITPRLVIQFKELNTKYKPQENEFDESKYFNIKGNKLFISPGFRAYSIQDYRKN